MSDHLLLLLGLTPDDPVDCVWFSSKSAKLIGRGVSLDEIGETVGQYSGAKIVAVLRGELVAMRSVPTPPRSESKFKAAAAFLLEDDLAENIENLHIATSRHASGAGLVCAVNSERLNNWIAELELAGVSPDIVTPEFGLIPLSDETATFHVNDGRIVGAVGLQGFSLERPLADSCLPEFVKTSTVEHVIGFGKENAKDIAFESILPQWKETHEGNCWLIEVLSPASLNDAPNLRTGRFKKQIDWMEKLGSWKRVAALMILCGGTLIGASVADTLRDERLATAISDETRALHVVAFPDRADVDPRENARTVLATQASAQEFLALSTWFAESVEAAEKIQIERIRYNADRSQFSVSFRFADINDLEQVKELLQVNGIVAQESGGVRRLDGAYIGELSVTTS